MTFRNQQYTRIAELLVKEIPKAIRVSIHETIDMQSLAKSLEEFHEFLGDKSINVADHKTKQILHSLNQFFDAFIGNDKPVESMAFFQKTYFNSDLKSHKRENIGKFLAAIPAFLEKAKHEDAGINFNSIVNDIQNSELLPMIDAESINEFTRHARVRLSHKYEQERTEYQRFDLKSKEQLSKKFDNKERIFTQNESLLDSDMESILIQKGFIVNSMSSEAVGRGKRVQTIPMLSSYIDEAIQRNIQDQPSTHMFTTRCLVNIPDNADDLDDVTGIEQGKVKGHWAYLEIRHGSGSTPSITHIRLDDSKSLSDEQLNFVKMQIKQIKKSGRPDIERNMSTAPVQDDWSGGYYALATLIDCARIQRSVKLDRDDPLVSSAMHLMENKRYENLTKFKDSLYKDLGIENVKPSLKEEKKSILSDKTDFKSDAQIISLAQFIGFCINRLESNKSLPLSYEGDGPGRSDKEIHKDKIPQESSVAICNRLKKAYETKKKIQLNPIEIFQSTPFELTKTNYIVSLTPEQEKIVIKDQLRNKVIGDPDAPGITQVFEQHKRKPHQPQTRIQSESQYVGTGAYEGTVNIIDAWFVKHICTQGIYPGRQEIAVSANDSLIAPRNILGPTNKSVENLKSGAHAPLHVEGGISKTATVGYIHGMVSAIPDAIQLQLPNLIAVAKERYQECFPERDSHGKLRNDYTNFIENIKPKQMMDLLANTLPELLGEKVKITEILIGDCTSKTSSCTGCTSYICACGLTPSAIHLGGAYSWIPPLPFKPPFQHASLEVNFILNGLYALYCDQILSDLKTGVVALSAYLSNPDKQDALGFDSNRPQLLESLEQLRKMVNSNDARKATEAYLDALTDHVKTADRPVTAFPLEAIYTKIALELANKVELDPLAVREKLKNPDEGETEKYINSNSVFDIQRAVLSVLANSKLPEALYLNELKSKRKMDHNLDQSLSTLNLNKATAAFELFKMDVINQLVIDNSHAYSTYDATLSADRDSILMLAAKDYEQDYKNAIDKVVGSSQFYIEDVFLKSNLAHKDNKGFITHNPAEAKGIANIGSRIRCDYVNDPAPSEASLALRHLANGYLNEKINEIVIERNYMDTTIERVAKLILDKWYPDHYREGSKDSIEYGHRMRKLNRADNDNFPENYDDIIKEQLRINKSIVLDGPYISEIGNVLPYIDIHKLLAVEMNNLVSKEKFSVSMLDVSSLGVKYSYLQDIVPHKELSSKQKQETISTSRHGKFSQESEQLKTGVVELKRQVPK